MGRKSRAARNPPSLFYLSVAAWLGFGAKGPHVSITMDFLRAMGFDDDSASAALTASRGDVERAVDFLLNPQPAHPLPNPVAAGPPVADSAASRADPGAANVIVLGISQYTFSDAGASACTAIAASAMKYLLELLAASPDCVFSERALSEVVTEGVMRFSQVSGGREHLAVDELGPGFFGDVRMLDSGFFQGVITEPTVYKQIFSQARESSGKKGYVGVIITKPPETVAIVLSNDGRRSFFFDSHSRPQLGLHGAYLVECGNDAAVESCLRRVFIPFPADPHDPVNFMYNMCDATAFQLGFEPRP